LPRWSNNTAIADALRDAARQLQPACDTARLDAELLLAHVLGRTRSAMLLASRECPGADVLERFDTLITRRMAQEPVAYIMGVQEFFGREFAVAPGVLIPRGDSECVVQAALDTARADSRVLDCGTGSGALLLTFLAERPAASGIGIDASCAAAAIANANAQSLGLATRAQVLLADWNQPGWADALGLFDLILANPPYVESDAALAPDVRDWEPGEALFAGPKGLDDYAVLVPHLPGLLNLDGVAVLEIGATQAAPVSELAHKAGFGVSLRHDLAGRPRALVLQQMRQQIG